jgi:hypothetical protein
MPLTAYYPDVTDADARADLLRIAATLSTYEVHTCVSQLRAGLMDGHSRDDCLLGIAARRRGVPVHGFPGFFGLREFMRWEHAHIRSGVWNDAAQLLESWLAAVLAERLPARDELQIWVARGGG